MCPATYPIDANSSSEDFLADIRADAPYCRAVYDIAVWFFERKPHVRSAQDVSASMQTAIHGLQRQLCAANPAAPPSVIFTIVVLGTISTIHADIATARTHRDGLVALIARCGGIKSLMNKPILQLKCYRLDLLIALQTETSPMLICSDSDAQDHDPTPSSLSSHSSTKSTPQDSQPTTAAASQASKYDPPITPNLPTAHPLLRAAYRDLRNVTQQLNLASQMRRTVSLRAYLSVLISVTYRLMHLAQDDDGDCDDEDNALCSAMLAMTVSMLFTAEYEAARCLKPVARRLFEALQRRPKRIRQNGNVNSYDDEANHNQSITRLSEQNGPSTLNLWLLCVAAMVCDQLGHTEKNGWIGERLQEMSEALKLNSWAKAKKALKAFVWVDLLHDAQGEKLWQESTAGSSAYHSFWMDSRKGIAWIDRSLFR